MARRAEVRLTRLHAGETPPTDAADLDLVVVMGGPMSVNDDATCPWLAAERRFVQSAIECGIAVLGVCLGAQLIAQVLGARVYKNSEREIGWWPIVGTSDEHDVPQWARAGSTTPVFHWHGETFDLPAGAELLASSNGCRHQAFRFGRRVVGVQFHLETTPGLAQALTTNCPEDLAPGRFIQSVAALQSVETDAYRRLEGLLYETLDYLCASDDALMLQPTSTTDRNA